MKKFYTVMWILVVAIFLVVHFFINKPSSNNVPLPPATPLPPNQGSGSLSYQNDEFGFSILYSSDASPSDDHFEGLLPATSSTAAAIFLNKSLFGGTNLIEAAVVVGVSNLPEALATCEKTVNAEEKAAGTATLNGEEFYMFSRTGVGAGNIYESKEYRKIHNGSCYEITEALHSGNIYNYPEGSAKEFDKVKFAGILDGIAKSFKFIPGQSGIIGVVSLGPVCPVERIPPDPKCAPKPYQTTISVYKAGDKDIIANAKSDIDGRFKFDLEPGKYELHPAGGKTLPRCQAQSVDVKGGVFSYVALPCDTGIR